MDIPFFNNSENGFLRAVLGGFQVNGVFQIQSGQPITIRSGIDSNRNCDAAGDRTISSRIYAVDANGVRINNATGVDILTDPSTVAYVAIKPSGGFIQTRILAREFVGLGDGLSIADRNSFRTQGFNNTDLVILKNTRFGTDGRFNFQIGAEIFDLFNQRPRTIVSVGAQTSAFGIAGNSSFNDYSIGTFTGRTVTLRAKFFF